MSVFWHSDAIQSADRHTHIFEYVRNVESDQSDIYERFMRYACLYDLYDRQARGALLGQTMGQVYENVCATGVDSISAIVAKNKPRAMYQTDGADWTGQRTAKQLEYYSKGLVKKYKVYAKM